MKNEKKACICKIRAQNQISKTDFFLSIKSYAKTNESNTDKINLFLFLSLMSLLQHKLQIFYLKTLFDRLHNVKIITFLNFAGLHKKIIVFFCQFLN